MNKRICIIAILTFIGCFYQHQTLAQAFDFNDPNLVFLDQKGNVLPLDSVKAIAARGPFSMQQGTLDNGKKSITIIPMTAQDVKEKSDEETKWIATWKDKPFPDFKLNTLEGKTIDQTSLKDKFTVINFWFIGCKPCQQEIPELNKLVDQYKDKSVQFFAPSFDNHNALTKFLTRKTFKYTILSEAKTLTDNMSILSYPTHIILDKKGIIREIIIGATPDIHSKLEEAIEKVMTSEK